MENGPSQTSAEVPVRGLPLERLEAEICSIAGQLAAGTCRYLLLLADFDAREGWAGWNVRSCAHWLTWRCGVDLRTAREHVRVARRLVELPHLAELFAAGRLSYSKARAIARVATAANERDLVDSALCATAAQIERLTRGMHRARRPNPEGAPDGTANPPSGISWHWDEDGSLVLWGRLDSLDGARLLASAVRAEAQRLRTIATNEPDQDPKDGSAEPSSRPPVPVPMAPPPDLAPALVAMSEMVAEVVSAPVHAPTAEVWVHVDTRPGRARIEAGHGEDGHGEDGRPEHPRPEECHTEQSELAAANQQYPARDAGDLPDGRIDDGPALEHADLARISCDAWIRTAVRRNGTLIGLGRRRRRPGGRLLAALFWRDRGCPVPGCGRVRFLHAHHVRHWARGGPTVPDNLLLLCGEHHRAVHDGVFCIEALGRQRFEFKASVGIAYPVAPHLEGAVADLQARRPDIAPGTIVPNWDGQHLDLDWAVGCLLDERSTVTAGPDGRPA